MSTRLIYTVGLLTVIALLGTSVYLQLFAGFIPCPLCTLQRLSFGIIGCLFFVGIFIHRSFLGSQLINLFALLASAFGMAFAGRQVWLQYFPSADSSECGVSLQYMMQVLPLNEVARKIFSGSAECSQRGYEFLGMTLANWALVWFIIFVCVNFYLLARKR